MQEEIIIERIKKSKKQKTQIFPALMLVDKEAFDAPESTRHILTEFWESQNNQIIVARKKSSQAVVGYAIYSVNEAQKDLRFG